MTRAAFRTLINVRIAAVASTLPRNDTVPSTFQPLNFSTLPPMFIYAAHLPHSPLMLTTIEKKRSSAFRLLREAVSNIADDLYARNIASIVTITPNGRGHADTYMMNVSPQFGTDFSLFGDFETKKQFAGDPVLASQIRCALCTRHAIHSVTQPSLDFATSVAMMQIQPPGATRYPVVPITHTLLPLRALHRFGASLREVLERIPQRVAVLTLGDFSRAREADQPQGRRLDLSIIQHLHEHDTDAFISHSLPQGDSFSVCALRPLAVLLGLLDEVNYTAEVLRYEQKFGIGMMVGKFTF